MTNDEKLMQQALDALDRNDYLGWQVNIPIIKALSARLAQGEVSYAGNGTAGRENMTAPTGFFFQMPKQPEPVAWVDDERGVVDFNSYVPEPGTPLYTAPPQREFIGLTDKEIMSLLPGAVRLPPGWSETARAIEAKLREKNT